MEIIRLADGQTPPAEVDCIRVFTLATGEFDLMGTALCDGDSVSLISEKHYATADAAIEEGVAWANQMNVTTLHVTLDPAPTEADKPL